MSIKTFIFTSHSQPVGHSPTHNAKVKKKKVNFALCSSDQCSFWHVKGITVKCNWSKNYVIRLRTLYVQSAQCHIIIYKYLISHIFISDVKCAAAVLTCLYIINSISCYFLPLVLFNFKICWFCCGAVETLWYGEVFATQLTDINGRDKTIKHWSVTGSQT